MCTVTYIPSRNDFFLTASRDEQNERTAALAPEIYRMNGRNILFPKDTRAGGTWIAVNENGNCVVFLNGALEKHVHRPDYRKSRGLILLDLITTVSPRAAFDQADLDQIEPFTAIISEERRLWVCRWNGSFKSANELDAGHSHIWSSATLYDSATIEKRKQWFAEWLDRNPDAACDDILRFHREAGDGDPHNDLLMNRDNKLFTHSISSLRVSGNLARFHYLDLRTMKSADRSIDFLHTIPVNA